MRDEVSRRTLQYLKRQHLRRPLVKDVPVSLEILFPRDFILKIQPANLFLSATGLSERGHSAQDISKIIFAIVMFSKAHTQVTIRLLRCWHRK